MADMTKFTDLPLDLIFSKILRRTRVAVQVSFILFRQWISVPALDFDEYDGFDHNDPHNHDRFVKFLKGYLEYYRDKGYHALKTLRFNMRLNTSDDVSILGRWLELAFEKGVEALDISCPRSDEPVACPELCDIEKGDDICYRCWHRSNYPVACAELCWLTTFANAKFLKSLKLDSVKFTSFDDIKSGKTDGSDPILPSLKALSLKALDFDFMDLAIVLRTCPSLEHLSLTNFRFERSIVLLKTVNLKSLKFMFCEGSEHPLFIYRRPEQFAIIESFTWIGVLSDRPSESFSWWMAVNCIAGKSLSCLNLQSVNIVEIRRSLTQRWKFPSLKTLSFTNIREVDDENIFSILLSDCHSLEHVSLTECCVKELIMKPHVSSSSLKSLEIKQCSQLRLVQIDDAKNLESFTFVWLPQQNPKPKVIHQQKKRSCKKVKERKGFRKVVLDNSFKLNNINICVNGFVEFSLNGCQSVRSHLDLTNSFHKIAPSARINIEPVQI